MRIAFVMDPLGGLVLQHDTTYVLMREAARRGHEVIHVLPSGVEYHPDGTALRGQPVAFTDDPQAPFELGPPANFVGSNLDAVLIRTDPPFDADYLTVSRLLDLLRPPVFVLNRPSGLRDANEKLAALHFPELCPPTLVSQDPKALDDFLTRQPVGAVVGKPLDGFGGSGVLLIHSDDPNRRTLWNMLTWQGTIKALAQAVVPGAEQGDTRIILLDGEPLGAVLRRNATGGFVHNLAAGGTAIPARLSEMDRTICARVGPWLRERGLWLAGIDVVGGRLIEINVTSPTCVQEINRFDGVALERSILNFIESKASQPRLPA